MKDILLQYAPVALFLVMMFIDKFGFGKMFSNFGKDIKDIFDVQKISEELTKIKGELGSVISELQEVRREIRREREVLQRVRGGK